MDVEGIVDQEGIVAVGLETSANSTECRDTQITPNTYLADSGASSHMGPGDQGMTDLES